MSGKAYRNPGAVPPMGRNERRQRAWTFVAAALKWSPFYRTGARYHLAQLVRP